MSSRVMDMLELGVVVGVAVVGAVISEGGERLGW